MKKLKVKDVVKLIDVSVLDGDISILNVQNDIKKIGNHTLVFHLNKTVELNINQFKSLRNCFIVTDQVISINDRYKSFILLVNDVDLAYDKFIDYYRNLFDIPIVAITGTCGKTTTKEMVKQILEKKYNVAATISNKNRIDKDLEYLLSIDDKTEYGVFETAISYPGDLLLGCKYFKPTIGVITNIGIDHLSGCKTLDNYIKTKGEMLAGLNYQGTLIINQDDDNIKKIDFSLYKGKLLTFGIDNEADYNAHNIQFKEKGMSFTIKSNNEQFNVYIPGFGIHNVYNALAAFVVLDELGMDKEEIIDGLGTIKYIRRHLEFYKGINDSTIIDDTWSSNPTSMKAAFAVLQEKGKDKTKIAVVGKISYLGEHSKEQYDNIGKMVNDYGIDILITVDSFSKQIGHSAKKYGMKPHRIIHCKDIDTLDETLTALLDNQSIVLFKVSIVDKRIPSFIKKIIINK